MENKPKTAVQEVFSELEKLHPHLFNIYSNEGREFVNHFHKFIEIENQQMKDIYTQCQEDMADKKYTDEDMEKCWYNAMDIAHGTDDFPMGGNKFKYPTFKEFINSLNKQD
ncbi:hypothetical protein UFOVP87_48 [uncultured Caudovirales phage]|uniref:Uncharacterized protein n=1 Tax=uncultured Caudovirales phage TaxID=2100421 RepID=A0A6J5L0I6_9CAUD|nr:hypothetical protein UFOVP87_48 [uncultured Caudovirales phage]